MKNLRIVFVGYLPPYSGGAGTANGRIVEALAARGHQLHAIAPITHSDREAGDWFAHENPAIRFHRFAVPSYMSIATTPKTAEMKAQELEFQRLTRDLLQSAPTDLVLLGGEVAQAALPVCKELGIPTVLVAHGGGIRRVALGLGTQEELAELRNLYQGVDHIIAVAQHLSPVFARLGYLHHSVVLNAIDTAVFCPKEKDQNLMRELCLPPGHFVVAHFSNLMPVKRPSDFVEAAALALQQNPNLVFLLTGANNRHKPLEERARALGIAHHFRFLGWIPQRLIHHYYSIVDAVAMMSESEARSMVYLETMASGKLLIASDIPAAREAIRDGETGLLFPVGDVHALAETILYAAAHPEAYQRIARQSRETIAAPSATGYGESLERVLTTVVR